MIQELVSSESEIRLEARTQSSCFACGLDNPRGLHLNFQRNKVREMFADWMPEPELEGYQGIVHGGIVSTVLDEAMSKVVAQSGVKALTAELRVRFRQHVPSGKMICVRGWIESQNKRMTKTEAVLTTSDGTELAHAWATFLALKYPGNIQS